MAKNSMTGGQETLSHPLNPSRKSAQPPDSDGRTRTNPPPIPSRKMSATGSELNVGYWEGMTESSHSQHLRE
ncbi:hypothetical protein [Komagataeibacter melomenusus]|uniref:hypothetical protein n=1 Tax=Komagataeibacter melomenusus TaxID=2766578 RepID=UPI001C2D1A2C|nr:hypothetical protein [Komagataeibacter melomenusus]